MPKARTRKQIFDCCDIVILFNKEKTTYYCGGRKNLWILAEVCRDKTRVLISGHWWEVDPSEWEIEGVSHKRIANYNPRRSSAKNGTRKTK